MGTTWSNDDNGSFSSFSSSEDAPAESPPPRPTGREQPPPPPLAANSGSLSLEMPPRPAPSSRRNHKPPIKLQQYAVAGQKVAAAVPRRGPPTKKKAGSSSSTTIIKIGSGPVVKQDTAVHASIAGSRGPPKIVPAAAAGTQKKKKRGSKPNWPKRYQELVAFHSHHGHCRVPQNTKQHLSLYNWCRDQKKRKEKQNLSSEEIQKLDQLGFEWTVKFRPTFEEKCQELEAFKKKFNHFKVPSQGEYESLYRWLYSIKCRYIENYSGGKKLNQNQIDRLESIGFVDWSSTKREGSQTL